MHRILALLFGISITSFALGAARSTPQDSDVYIPDKAIIAQINEYNACRALHLPQQKPWYGDSAQLIATLISASNGRVISMPTDKQMFIYKSYSPLHYMIRIPHVPLLSYVIWRGNLTFAEQLAADSTFVSPADQYGNTALHYLWQYMQRFSKYNRKKAGKAGKKLPSASQVLYRTQKLFKLLAPLTNIGNLRGNKPLTCESFGLYPGKFITYVWGTSTIDPKNFESYIRDYLIFRWQKKPSKDSCSLLDTTCVEICARPTEEEFIEVLKTLHQSCDFRSAVWRALSQAPTNALFPTGTRTTELQKIADKLHARTSSWMEQLLSEAEEEDALTRDLGALYVFLLRAAQKIDAPAEKRAWLLELYRNAFATDCLQNVATYGTILHEYEVSETLESTLCQLGRLGIKPGARLCPDNDNDTRTLFYAWLLHNPIHFKSIFALLSPAEMNAEAILLQQSQEFTAKVVQQLAEEKEVALMPDDPYAEHWRILLRAYYNQRLRNRSLFELLLPRLYE